MNQSIKWDEIRPQIEEDISENGVARGEFVVSAMTKAIANAISHYLENNLTSQLPALDIGTGTGYHTALLLSKGHQNVISVDINPQAIDFAKDRISRYLTNIKQFEEPLFAKFLEKASHNGQAVNFFNYSLDDLTKNKEARYALVSFNPPILYPFLETEFDKPATHGVYFENKEVKQKENDLVYRLYDTIARNNLKKGSHIVCIWANLNRHLVELNPFEETQPQYVHPSKILENWFDFKFENEAEDFDDFYCHKTILGAGFFNQSATGKLYSDNIRHGIDHHFYSKLLIPSQEESLAGTYFHFGVLHLEKTSDTENNFKIINGSSLDK